MWWLMAPSWTGSAPLWVSRWLQLSDQIIRIIQTQSLQVVPQEFWYLRQTLATTGIAYMHQLLNSFTWSWIESPPVPSCLFKANCTAIGLVERAAGWFGISVMGGTLTGWPEMNLVSSRFTRSQSLCISLTIFFLFFSFVPFRWLFIRRSGHRWGVVHPLDGDFSLPPCYQLPHTALGLRRGPGWCTSRIWFRNTQNSHVATVTPSSFGPLCIPSCHFICVIHIRCNYNGNNIPSAPDNKTFTCEYLKWRDQAYWCVSAAN